MVLFKEREKKPESIEQLAEEASPLRIERKEVVKPVPSQFTAQVKHQGKPVIQTPKTQPTAIQLPAAQSQLVNWSKGKIEDARTWLGKFFLRLIEKAKLFGWKIVGK